MNRDQAATSNLIDTSSVIPPLQPQAIGGLYGRPGSLTSKLLPKQPAKVRILALSAPILIALLVLAYINHVLTGPDHVLAAFGLQTLANARPTHVSLPILCDPVALVVLLTALLTPVCCAEQVASIELVVPMIVKNVSYRMDGLDVEAIKTIVRRVNKAFEIVGLKSVSALFLLVSFIESYAVYRYIEHHGLLSSWNPSKLSNTLWRKEVYNGWWANAHTHSFFAALLVIVSTYYLYHLTKQLALGLIFAVFGGTALDKGFGATPNLRVNTDGYYGMRILRYFMQWTYMTTLLGYVLAIGVFAVWLPFNQVAAVVIGIVVVSNIITVVYPTTLVTGGVLLEKQHFIQHLMLNPSLSSDKLNEIVEGVWKVPTLPFRIRGTLSAATLYLLIPTILAFVSSSLK
ncbi:MAG: hypothetical protein ABSC34_09555 [Acidimicrobiales bacterium]